MPRTSQSGSETGEPTAFEPFADDMAVQTLGGLSIENGTRHIALHGSLDLTRDRQGLARAKSLKDLLDTIVSRLEAQDLPEQVADDTRAPRQVANPFA